MLSTIIFLAASTALAAPATTAQIPIGGAAPVPGPAAQTDPPTTDDVGHSSSVDCQYSYCESSTLWCFYWAGVTGYDVSLGPLPGETRTSVDTCDPATDLGPAPTVATLPAL